MKDKFMMIRATEEEKETANLKAKEMGLSMSAFVRFLIRQWDRYEKPQNQRESRLWVIPEILYALYLKIRK